MIRAVIFDLDGTLADTAALGHGRRAPWQVLEPGYQAQRDWRWSQAVSDLPGDLISRGYRVAVATRAPLAYASTLLHLIGADTEVLLATSGAGVSKAPLILNQLARWGLHPDEAVYVGDEPDDAAVALAAGVHYADVGSLRDGRLGLALQLTPPGRPADIVRRSDRQSPVFATGVVRVGNASFDAVGVAQRLADSFRAGIPDAGEHGELLDVIFQHPGISRRQRAAFCYFSLNAQPGLPYRMMLQHGLFAGVQEDNAKCLIRRSEGLFSLLPAVVTRSELRRDAGLHRRLLRSLTSVFPARAGVFNVGASNVPFRFLQTYKVGFGGILGEAKQYGGPRGSRFRSGSEVQFEGLDLVADIMTSALNPALSSPLVPIPATPFSREQPGEVSNRLAILIAQRSERSLRSIVHRLGDDLILDSQATPGPVVLIDDHTTSGSSVLNVARHLQSAKFEVQGILSFSASPPAIAVSGSQPHLPTQTCGFGEVADWLGITCHCRR